MAFKEWAAQEGLIRNAPLDEFRGTRIGIDAEDYLTSLLVAPNTREPLLPALGGLPFSLQKNVDADLKSFQEAGITPIFIFNGVNIASQDRAAAGKQARKASGTLNDAWSIYDSGHGDGAVAAFGKACTYRIHHIIRWLQAHLYQAGIISLTAPYNAAMQLVYMESADYVDGVAGSASCLMFGADKVITRFDWDARHVSWVGCAECQNKCRLSKDQLIDLLLLSGFGSILAPLPEIDEESSPVQKVQNTITLLNRFGDGHAVCMTKGEEYLTVYRKARSAVKHPIVLEGNGKIEPRNAEKAPNDVHEFITEQLPAEIYFYLSRGVIGPRVLNWRTSKEVYETPPLDGGNSQAYKDLVLDKLRPQRAQTIALLTRMLHRWFHKLDVDLICWFNENERRPLGIPDMISEPSDSEKTWHVRHGDIPISEAEIAAKPLSCAIRMLSDDSAARQTVTERAEGEAGILSKPNELLINTVFRFLHDRGYINPDHTLSAWGRALKVSLDRAQSNGLTKMASTSTEVDEAVLIAFELLRLDILNNKAMFATFSGQPLRGSETDKANTLLVSRIACLGLFHHKAIGYTGPLSRHLLAYHQMTSAVRSSLRDLVEMHGTCMLLSGAVSRDLLPTDLTALGARLPFLREPDLGLALMVKSYLDELANDVSKRTDIRGWFSHATDLYSDLEKAWNLWDAVNAGIQAADSSIVNNETRKLFKNTDDWLERKRASAPTVNGTS